MPAKQHDQGTGSDAGKENNKYIDADDSANQNKYIRKHLQKMIGLIHSSMNLCPERQNQDQNQCDHRRRKCDPEVFPEFIFHLTALSVTGCDCCIGNKRKIIPEHCTTHDRSDTKRQIKPGCCRYRNCDRCQQGDRSHGSSHRHRHKTGNHEQYRHRKSCRNQCKHEISHTFRTASSDNADKAAGGKKDQEHRDNILIPHSLRHQLQFFIKIYFPILYTRH